MQGLSRRTYLAAAGTAMIAGCLGESDGEVPSGDDDGARPNSSDDRAATPERESSGSDDDGQDLPIVPRELPLPADTETIADAMQRGARKDAIPAIGDPEFFNRSTADEWLDPGHPVFGVVRNGEAKAYPQRVLVWHEIVNDHIGGDPVAVTYCPLTGTAQGFERGGATFGVSGQLVNSNLVMYDRGTDSYWPQMLAVGVTGPHEGDQLIEFNVTWTSWERWRETYPETSVLSDDTGWGRDYGRDPYGSYDPPSGHYENRNLMFPQFGSGTDQDFHPKRVVIGARTADGALAVFKDTLAESEVVEIEVGGVSYVVVYDSALHTGWVYRNPDAATVEHAGASVLVDEVEHPPDDTPLESVIRYDAMWFAWEGYYPGTEVVA